MKRKISDVARMLGISAAGIRLYEKRGIVTAQKEENSGYRYYDVLDVSALMRSRAYRGFGYTMQQTAELLNEKDPFSVLETHEKQIAQLREEIRFKEQAASWLTRLCVEQRRLSAELGKCRVEMSPPIYRIEFMGKRGLLEGCCPVEVVQRWMEYMPFALMSVRYPLAVLQEKESRENVLTGLCVEEQDGKFLGIEPNEFEEYIPARWSVYTLLRNDRENMSTEESLIPLYKFLKENGLEPVDDGISRTILAYDKAENYPRYRQLWVPVKEKGH